MSSDARVEVNANALPGAYRWGIIGYGKVAVAHMDGIMRNRDWLKGFSTRDPDIQAGDARKLKFNMGAEGKLFNVEHMHVESDYRKLLDDPDIDGFIVCAPTDAHVAVALDVAASGKDCFLEKPIAPTSVEGQKIVDAFASAEGRLAIGHVLPSISPFEYLLRTLQQRGFGSVSSLFMQRNVAWGDTDDEKSTRGRYGYLMDLGVHDVNLLLSCGTPRCVCVDQSEERYDQVQYADFRIQFMNCDGQFRCAIGADPKAEGFRHSYKVRFDDGVTLDFDGSKLEWYGRKTEPVTLQNKDLPAIFGDEQMVASGYFCGQSEPEYTSADAAVTTVEVIEAVSRSAREKTSVAL